MASIRLELLTESAGLTDCPGIRCGATACDIRENGSDRLDLAIITGADSATRLATAGVFTRNDVRAAPVYVSQASLKTFNGYTGGCIVNSGNANACTGEEGMRAAEAMAGRTAQACARAEQDFTVCSTGRIGRQLPLPKILTGIDAASTALGDTPEHGRATADAILTSDTRRKVVTVRIHTADHSFTVSGCAKGAGMIEPNMATMLAFVATDLEASPEVLQTILRTATDKTFNRISIDGDMSTNDTVLLFATGASGVTVPEAGELRDAFAKAVEMVCNELAEKIVGDGEKITKVIELLIQGAPSAEAADKVARAIANSLLVKSSWYGSDPNWGRLIDAAGYARIGLVESKLDLHYNDCPALLGGVPQDSQIAQWKAIVARRRFTITLNLNLGDHSTRLLTTDLSEAYVNFNKSE